MLKRCMLFATAIVVGAFSIACTTTKATQPLHPPPFPSDMEKDIWQAASTSSAIVIDGRLEDAWKTAPVKTVWVRRGVDFAHQYPVHLRALYDGDHVYLSAQWPDLTDDSMPRRYVWNENQGAYEPSDKAEDMFSFSFELKGEMISSMLTTQPYTADVWHWKAGRGNASGYADDKRHIVSPTPIEGHRAHAFDLYDGSRCWLARPADSGDAPYRRVEAPENYQDKYIPSYEQVAATGSRGDVRARGEHDARDGIKYWTVEFMRKLNTGTDDDVIFRMQKDLPVSIAVFRQARDIDHEVSDVFHLRFRTPVDEK